MKSQADVVDRSTALSVAVLPDPTKPTVIRTQAALKDLAKKLAAVPEVVADLETCGLDPRKGEIVGIGVALPDNGPFYIPVGHRFEADGSLRPRQLPLVNVLTALRLQEKHLIGHNAKYEFKWLKHHGNIRSQFIWDTMIAARLLHSDLPADLKTVPDKRDRIKSIQFGLIYGKTPYSLAIDLKITKEEAEQLVADYFRQFPAIQTFITKVHKNLLRDGFVDDVFGRRRHLSIVKHKVPRKKYHLMTTAEKELIRKINAAKRQAQNFVIQGASATITKLAMIRCHRHITEKYGNDVKMILTLHDELQFEVREELVPGFAAELPGLMCNLGLERFGFKLPLAVEVKTGPSWGEMTKWNGIKGTTKDGKSINTRKG